MSRVRSGGVTQVVCPPLVAVVCRRACTGPHFCSQHPVFCSQQFRNSSWVLFCLSIFWSRIYPSCACTQLFWIPNRKWQPTPVFLPGESCGQKSLVGCYTWGHTELDTDMLSDLACIRGGNGSPLQYSCLENPRDGGAWWAAVCGVSQSQTRLKRLSSSSSSSFFVFCSSRRVVSRCKLCSKGSQVPHLSHHAFVWEWEILLRFWRFLLQLSRFCLQCRRLRFNPWVRKIPWRRKWQPTSPFLPGESHGQRSLRGYSPWGHKESDTTQWLTFHFSSSSAPSQLCGFGLCFLSCINSHDDAISLCS